MSHNPSNVRDVKVGRDNGYVVVKKTLWDDTQSRITALENRVKELENMVQRLVNAQRYLK